MSGISARKYNRDMAKNLSAGIRRILDRVNRKYTPTWMLLELIEAEHKAQCIQREFEMVMKGFGDEL